MKTPIVSIVGKPNVGKSTLFNKIAGDRIAIEAEEAGTTRDRIFHKVSNKALDFFMVDTGGLQFGKTETSIEDDMRLQATIAIEESDVILFVLDAKTDLTADDFQVAELLRKRTNKKPVMLVLNKCDTPLNQTQLAEFYQLGFDRPHTISAIHRTGLRELIDAVVKALKAQHFLTKDMPEYAISQRFDESHVNVATVGRPNVGKSSLINALLNKEKLIVSDIPGTTRDSVDCLVRHDDKDYNFIDTAGLRRRGRIESGIEKFSALRSMAAIERCDVALLVVDTSEDISHQDQQIASHVLDSHKGLILVANKWDIKPDESEKDEVKRRDKMIARLQHKFPFLSWAPVVLTSARTKKNLTTLFEQIDGVHAARQQRVATSALNDFMEQIVREHKPTGAGHTNPKILYITQVGVNPPHFVVFVNRESAFHFSYLRYVENRLREKFGFTGTAIKIEYRERKPTGRVRPPRKPQENSRPLDRQRRRR